MTSWHVSVKARIGTFDLDVSLVGDARPVALVGPNGSGKTTLLRVIAGAIEVQQAHVQQVTWNIERRIGDALNARSRNPIQYSQPHHDKFIGVILRG